jgi:hypothetical protein
MLYSDQYFTATELGLEELNPFISCDIQEETDDEGNPTGKMNAYLKVLEDLEFHRNLDREQGNPHNQLFTLEDRPTESVISVLRKLVEDRYKGENFELDDTGTEYFEFEIVLTVDPETTPEDLGVKFWEETELVRFHNEADPGTFNSPYLFGSLVYDGLRELDS